MTNYEKMKPFMRGVGIGLAAKVLAEGPGRCKFCAEGKRDDGFKCRGKCEEGIREWLNKEAEEDG